MLTKLILCLSANSPSRDEISSNRGKSEGNTEICPQTSKRYS